MEQREEFRHGHDARRRGLAGPRGTERVTFVLDRDLHVLDVVSPLGFHGGVQHWMDLVDVADRGAAYDALSRALVTHRPTHCELRFTRLWNGHVLRCTFQRSPLSRPSGGFLVHVERP